MSTAENTPNTADHHEAPAVFAHYNLDSRDPKQVLAGLSLVGLQRRLDDRRTSPVTLPDESLPAAEHSDLLLPSQRCDEGEGSSLMRVTTEPAEHVTGSN